MLVSSPSMYCTTTGVNSSRKAVWNLPSFMVAAGRKGQCGGQGVIRRDRKDRVISEGMTERTG